MDNFWSPTGIGLFILFFVPGFISQKIYGLIVPDDAPESTTAIISAVAYSSLNYALASPIIYWGLIHGRQANPYVLAALLLLVLLVLPTILPLIWLWIRRRPFIRKRTLSPIKRPWDYVFDGRDEYWVIVTFKDGERLAGIYGQNSFSSSYPRKEQIYLEKAWVLDNDGKFAYEAPQSQGVIILSDEVVSIELFSSPEGNHV